METVDDAIRADKTHLRVWCAPCRVTHEVPWRLLRGVVGSTKLADLKARLFCRKCGVRPDPEEVWPMGPSDRPKVPQG